jgi:hypothetical protein
MTLDNLGVPHPIYGKPAPRLEPRPAYVVAPRSPAAIEIDVPVYPFGPAPIDPGGVLYDYTSRVRLADRVGVEIEIRGTCVSACTVYLGAKNVCVHPDARFWFHAAHDGKTRRVNDYATQQMATHWPPPIREWAKVVGATDSVDFTPRRSLLGADLIRMGVRRC